MSAKKYNTRSQSKKKKNASIQSPVYSSQSYKDALLKYDSYDLYVDNESANQAKYEAELDVIISEAKGSCYIECGDGGDCFDEDKFDKIVTELYEKKSFKTIDIEETDTETEEEEETETEIVSELDNDEYILVKGEMTL